jgi:outer membrane protein assembly factor BamB
MNNARFHQLGLFVILLWGFAGPVAADGPPAATNLWVIKLSKFACFSSPALAPGGTIYQATFDGTLLAVSPQGNIIWTFDPGTGTEIKSSPAIAEDGTIYFGSRDRKFYAVTPQGKLKWVFATGGWVDSSPAIAADGTVYFGGWDKNFYALDPSGAQKWVFAVGAIVTSSPAIAADGTIYFGALDKNLYALRPDGRLKWTFATSGEITSSPAIGADGAVYFNSTDGYLYCLKPDGTERWRYHDGNYTECSPILDENENVTIAGFAGAGNIGQFLVTKDGQGHTISGLSCPVDASAVAVTGEIYCSRPWRTVQAFHTNGDLLWSAATEANVTASPVVGPDGVVYVMGDRFLYAVRPVGQALPLANSSWPMFRANPRHTGRVGK